MEAQRSPEHGRELRLIDGWTSSRQARGRSSAEVHPAAHVKHLTGEVRRLR
jgi:hypothetical protein